MSSPSIQRSRRDLLKAMLALPCLGAIGAAGAAVRGDLLTRPIPGSGERLPVIGMGTWQTFDETLDPPTRARLLEVLSIFFDRGGRLIDSSPMYGRAEAVVGELIAESAAASDWFAATKVWTRGREAGLAQMRRSAQRMGKEPLDLMQIHNLLDWRTHVETLKQWQADGRLRYIGITTSHGRSHRELEQALSSEPFDFVQLTYSIANREVENRLLPLAQERGIAVLANRPYQGGQVFSQLRGKPLPAWAADIDCASWGQFMLKFLVSHPAVTCAIPATSNPKHMRDNMAAAYGRLPDAAMRRRMLSHFENL